MSGWTDSHNHLQVPGLGAVIGVMKQAGIDRCVVNATREADWATVADLAVKEPDFVSAAFGIHPWQAHTAGPGWLARLTEMLANHPQASIGECGLDGWVIEPPLAVQRPIFIAQLRLARELDRAMTIHCLKAWEALFECFGEVPPPARFLMHSFGGSFEIARRLLPLGAYFSFSGYFLHPRKSKAIEVFRQLPRERILLETDAPDMRPPEEFIRHGLPENRNHPANLPAIGEALAAALGMTPEALAGLTAANSRCCFG